MYIARLYSTPKVVVHCRRPILWWNGPRRRRPQSSTVVVVVPLSISSLVRYKYCRAGARRATDRPLIRRPSPSGRAKSGWLLPPPPGSPLPRLPLPFPIALHHPLPRLDGGIRELSALLSPAVICLCRRRQLSTTRATPILWLAGRERGWGWL